MAKTPIDELLELEQFYVAHRCGGGDWPEFSQVGVAGSLAQGYRALEVSVWWSADDEWVLSHDYTTERMTGVRHVITETDWATLSTLESSAAGTSNTSQPTQPLMRLSDLLAVVPEDIVLFIDHKATSDGEGQVDGQNDRDRLLDFLETIPGAQGRVVWKTFSGGAVSAAKALARGFDNWGIFYAGQPVADPSLYRILGMEYNADQSEWDVITAHGVPVIAHIVRSVAARDMGQEKGAAGYMATRPTIMP